MHRLAQVRVLTTFALVLGMLFVACGKKEDPATARAALKDELTRRQAAMESGVAYIATSLRIGVRVRSDCNEDGGDQGNGWPEGTRVEVVQAGTGACTGWSLVRADTGTESWVKAGWLSSTPPVSRP